MLFAVRAEYTFDLPTYTRKTVHTQERVKDEIHI